MNLKELYESIENVNDETSRKILYIQFIHKHFPKAYEALLGDNNKVKGGNKK